MILKFKPNISFLLKKFYKKLILKSVNQTNFLRNIWQNWSWTQPPKTFNFLIFNFFNFKFYFLLSTTLSSLFCCYLRPSCPCDAKQGQWPHWVSRERRWVPKLFSSSLHSYPCLWCVSLLLLHRMRKQMLSQLGLLWIFTKIHAHKQKKSSQSKSSFSTSATRTLLSLGSETSSMIVLFR